MKTSFLVGWSTALVVLVSVLAQACSDDGQNINGECGANPLDKYVAQPRPCCGSLRGPLATGTCRAGANSLRCYPDPKNVGDPPVGVTETTATGDTVWDFYLVGSTTPLSDTDKNNLLKPVTFGTTNTRCVTPLGTALTLGPDGGPSQRTP